MFMGLLSFRGPLTTECMSLNNEQFKTRPFLIDFNHVELNYYLFMITLDKCNGSVILWYIWQNICPKQNRRCK